ncbi:ovarian-specific serine/threonine-protein kinase Lok-like [Chironomus tepperi]|uniref:ovarian-specific serine/threonine-protein kinase Lok-like n=1 Tax=Chironomus tepperi TaxID=113505 RepID=UPI00391EE516
MGAKKTIKPIARLVSHSKEMNYEIFNNNVDFVMLKKKNDVNSEELITIIPIDVGGNKENGIVCKIEKQHDDSPYTVKPFVFRSFHDNLFLINDKLLRKGQRIILQNKDRIKIVKNINNFIEFHDLRTLIKTKFPQNLMKDYFVEKLLGDGPNGRAYFVHNVRTLERLALKRVKKFEEDPPNDLAFEAKIMNNLNHPNIVKLLHVHDELRETFLFTEYMNFRDILNLITSKTNVRLEENEARVCFYQVTQGLKYLHQLNICHRDIKCDNIFVHKENDNYICKIGDFGLSAYDKDLTQTCGTLLYSPPEMFYKNQVYKGTKADIWSFGVVLFCMISGKFPFHKSFESYGTVEEQIKGGIIRFRCDEIWNDISYECKHLICCMMNVNPLCRYDIHEIEKHPWVKNHVKLHNVRKRSLDVTLLKNVKCIQNFVAKKPKISMLT